MIYLIDDNQFNQRIERYGIYYVEENIFGNILTSVSKIEKDGDLEFLNDADCILMHSTTEDVVDGRFVKGSISNVTRIKESISREGANVPLVLFSHGMNETADFPNVNYIRKINKPVLYSRLFDFLTYYSQFGHIELNILAYGKNFIYIKASEHIHELVKVLQFRNRDELLGLADIRLSSMKSLFEIADFDLPFDNFIIWLEDNPITIGKYIDNLTEISESFALYGKNIYGWSRD